MGVLFRAVTEANQQSSKVVVLGIDRQMYRLLPRLIHRALDYK